MTQNSLIILFRCATVSFVILVLLDHSQMFRLGTHNVIYPKRHERTIVTFSGSRLRLASVHRPNH